jgi:hypothetical protein
MFYDALHLGQRGGQMMSTTMIPQGVTLRSIPNGDVFLTWPGAMVPYLCVQKDQRVSIAFVRDPVNADLAEAARQYVAQHLLEEQSRRE